MLVSWLPEGRHSLQCGFIILPSFLRAPAMLALFSVCLQKVKWITGEREKERSERRKQLPPSKSKIKIYLKAGITQGCPAGGLWDGSVWPACFYTVALPWDWGWRAKLDVKSSSCWILLLSHANCHSAHREGGGVWHYLSMDIGLWRCPRNQDPAHSFGSTLLSWPEFVKPNVSSQFCVSVCVFDKVLLSLFLLFTVWKGHQFQRKVINSCKQHNVNILWV